MSLRRVLVANRGEIACRIIDTLDRMEVESVAVYTEPDHGALHVERATVACPLGGPNGYLDGARIVETALTTGADAVHPGYGFLAEDAAFARAVEEAGLAFVGPTPDQIRHFGRKDDARRAAAAAGLRVSAGSDALTVVDDALRAAPAVGFPLLVKSVAGGGGIGMLPCRDERDLADTVTRAMAQSETAFGSRAVFLERLVDRARHVEVQVFGDGHGRVECLGARDCSVQRRRQKVVEETPPPGIDARALDGLFASATALLTAVAYRSAGTVEFLFDVDTGAFSFLEVNTRLQVEHAVTEAVFGVDLVEWMVRLADGDTAFLDEARPPLGGHAIEVRLYAEDPSQGYRPCPGVVTAVQWPSDARVDTWVRAGTEVSPFYDALLAKVVVHAPTRDGAVDALVDALAATRVHGVETNRDLAASYVASDEFRSARMTTTSLEQHVAASAAVEVLAPGHTTVQDVPGRVGLWHVGVPPSGPMDDRSFRLGNRLLGNPESAPGLECTAAGLELRFRRDTAVCLTGAPCTAEVDGVPVPYGCVAEVRAGQRLTVGDRPAVGLRTYVLVRGGIDVPNTLGSASTFTLGGFGGHGGRALRVGDVLHLGEVDGRGDESSVVDAALPELTHDWELAVVDGPHGAPDFLTDDGIRDVYAAEWAVHHHSDRTGVRLVGPPIGWARSDGGEAGLHPSNIHDSPYTVGAVDLTGDMPIVLGPDGPSLGGFTCPLTVIADDRWKLGQLAPGDHVRFVPVDVEEAHERAASSGQSFANGRVARTPRRLDGPASTVLGVRPRDGEHPQVVYRAQGDRAVLVEYGPMALDFDLRLRAHALDAWLAAEAVDGVVETTPGIRSLQVQYDPAEHTPTSLVRLLEAAEDELPALDDVQVESRVVHLPLSWDDPSTREAIERYMRVVRDDAPWCPWNIEFIRRVNGLDGVDDVRRVLFDAEYLVLGLGDVYLGAPVAVPIDPRHRLVTTKYNPARTWTPENAVGIGGAYLCVYGMEGPGGYQFVGRTVPVWDTYGRGPHTRTTPWLLRCFDRIRWFEVGAEELLDLRTRARAGRLALDVQAGTFSRAEHQAFLREHATGIAAFEERRGAAFAAERRRWEESGELSRQASAAPVMAPPGSTDVGVLDDHSVVVEAPLHGSVARIHIEPGGRIEAGDTVVTLEAMKTETAVTCPTGGVVVRVLCDAGAVVAAGSPLAVVQVDG